MWKVLSQGIHMCNMKALSLLVRKLWSRLIFFSKVGQTLRSRGQKLEYHVKGLVTRNTHVQYERPISSCKKVMPKVKVFKSRSNFKVKNYGIMWKVLSQGIHMCKMKALTFLVRKLYGQIKVFFKSRSNFKFKVTRSNMMVPCERSCHKKYTSAI